MNCIAAWASKTTSNGRGPESVDRGSQVKSSRDSRVRRTQGNCSFSPQRFASASVVEFARGADCRCGVAPNLNVHSCPNKKSNPNSVVQRANTSGSLIQCGLWDLEILLDRPETSPRVHSAAPPIRCQWRGPKQGTHLFGVQFSRLPRRHASCRGTLFTSTAMCLCPPLPLTLTDRSTFDPFRALARRAPRALLRSPRRSIASQNPARRQISRPSADSTEGTQGGRRRRLCRRRHA